MAGDLPGGGPPAGAGGDAAGGAGALRLEEEFGAESLYALRQAVAAHAAAAGMSGARASDVALAVNELASNAVRHGAGRGRLRIWGRDGALACQVQDAGREPRGGRPAGRDAGADADAAAGWPYARGHGLWLVRLLADQMTVVSGPAGTCVTVIFGTPDLRPVSEPGIRTRRVRLPRVGRAPVPCVRPGPFGEK